MALIVPAVAAVLALLLPAALQIQLIEPADGIVEADDVPARATPAAVLPSTGVSVNVAPPSIALW